MLSFCDGARFLYPSGTGKVFSPGAAVVTGEEMNEAFNRICGYSVHSHADSLNSGYITLRGGHRAGICGTAVTDGARVISVKDISCIDLRIARQVRGAANPVFSALFTHGVPSVLIAGGPSTGKTTVLRDLARQLSGGQRGLYLKTVICDERSEIAAVYRGTPSNDVGVNTDVLDAYPKKEAIMIALRSFSPQIIICDEVGTPQEVEAIRAGLNAGVSFIASVHASTSGDLISRPQIKELILTGAFEKVVLLSHEHGKMNFYDAKELENEIRRGDNGVCLSGNLRKQVAF